MCTLYILLGGNIGESQTVFNEAEKLIIKNIGAFTDRSSFYRSPAWGFSASQDFLNRVLKVQTALLPLEVLRETQKIELLLGRKVKTSKEQYESRIIDIDILFYDKQIINTDVLTIPHPRLHLRNFTLKPLLEIAPNLIHPLLGKTIIELYQETIDDSVVIQDK